MKTLKVLSVAAGVLILNGCASTLDNSGGRATVYEDVNSSSSQVQGVGIESQDIAGVADKMVRSMLQNPDLAGRSKSPRVVIDEEYLTNESTSRINKKIITDRLRVHLNRAARGKMTFVGRHFSKMVDKERELKRSGLADKGTIRTTKAVAGADFRLGGNITSLDAVNKHSGTTSRTTQIIFEMVDLEYGTIVWSDIFDFKKTAQDDVLYR